MLLSKYLLQQCKHVHVAKQEEMKNNIIYIGVNVEYDLNE